MCKTAVIISALLFLNLYSRGQHNSKKISFIYEVDSILNHIKDLKNDQVILYYPNGAIRYGIILWSKGNISGGLAFKKTTSNFSVKNISKENINKSLLLNQFRDSFDVFKKYISTGGYNTSHDFNIAWFYSVNMKTDTVIRLMSEILGGRDHFGRMIYLKFEKLYDLSIPSTSSSTWRKKRQLKRK